MRSTALALALAMALASTACHTTHVWVADGRPGHVEFDWQNYFFWGLTPAKTIDVSEHCPGGAVAIRENTTFADGLVGLLTLGVWTPRSSWYYCAAEGF